VDQLDHHALVQKWPEAAPGEWLPVPNPNSVFMKTVLYQHLLQDSRSQCHPQLRCSPQ
jgi:hypothetical protein